MKKTIDFTRFYIISAVVAAAVCVAGAVMFLLFGGGAYAHFTAANFNPVILVKTAVSAVLVFAFVFAYLAIRFKKNGLKAALMSTIGAAVSALCAVALCVICRAPLGNYTFAVALEGVCISFITSCVYLNSKTEVVTRKKKSVSTESYNDIANKAFGPLFLMLVIVALSLIAAFAAFAVFGVQPLMLYVLAALLTAVVAVFFTLAFTCRIYADKA